MTRLARVAITPRRRQTQPRADAVVEGAPDLAQTNEARARRAQAFADLYADVLLDALVRQQRGANPVEAIRAALAEAETRMARC